MGETNGILDNVDLGLEGRREFNSGVADDKRPCMARYIHDEAVADTPCRSNTGIARYHGAHQFIGVKAFLHKRVGAACAHKFDCLGCRIVAVKGVNQLEGGNIERGATSHFEIRFANCRPAPTSLQRPMSRWASVPPKTLDRTKPAVAHRIPTSKALSIPSCVEKTGAQVMAVPWPPNNETLPARIPRAGGWPRAVDAAIPAKCWISRNAVTQTVNTTKGRPPALRSLNLAFRPIVVKK